MGRVLIGALVVCVCAWRTHDRAIDWRSDEALWTAAVRSAPNRPRPALNLAMTYARQGRWKESQWWTARAARLMTPRDAWMRPHLCRQIDRLAVLAPAPVGVSVECVS